MRLTVAITVVLTNAYVVKVDDTTSWFLLMKKPRFSLMLSSPVDFSPQVFSNFDEEIWSKLLSDGKSSVESSVGSNLYKKRLKKLVKNFVITMMRFSKNERAIYLKLQKKKK